MTQFLLANTMLNTFKRSLNLKTLSSLIIELVFYTCGSLIIAPILVYLARADQFQSFLSIGPNKLNAFSIIILLFCISLAFKAKTIRAKIFAVTLLPIVMFGILQTTSLNNTVYRNIQLTENGTYTHLGKPLKEYNATSFKEVHALLERSHTRASDFEYALYLMNAVSHMFPFGPGGCLIEKGYNPKVKITYTDFSNSKTGMCNDFAYILSMLLSYSKIENRIVIIPGHIFNEAKINENWVVLDPTTNIAIPSTFSKAIQKNQKTKLIVLDHKYTKENSPHFREALAESRHIFIKNMTQKLYLKHTIINNLNEILNYTDPV